jgi:hypothetical protein
MATAGCADSLTPEKHDLFTAMIHENPVVLFGLENFKCTSSAEQALPDKGVCFHKETLEGPSDPLLVYLKCANRAAIGDIGSGKNMEHSFLYVDG